MSKKQKYYVYIGQLRKEFALSVKARKKNVDPDPNKFGLYVGSSSKSPKERWKQHLTKARNRRGKLYSKVASEWGMNYIHWRKFKKFNPIHSRVDAERIEKELAMKYSAKGYATWSDQLPNVKEDKQFSMLERWAIDEAMYPGNPLGMEKAEGPWISYYDNGQKKIEGAFKNGREFGKWTYFNPDGSIKKIENY